MVKQDLISTISEETGVPKSTVDKVISSMLSTITEKVRASEEVRLKGFGCFKLVNRAARVARDPVSGASIQLPAKLTAVFKPSVSWKDVKIN